jgi:hypothetical protein
MNMIKAMRLPKYFRISIIKLLTVRNRRSGCVLGGGSHDYVLDGDFSLANNSSSIVHA